MPGVNEVLSALSMPPLLIHFLLVVALSFTIGLGLHSYRQTNNQDLGFGSTRTFTLIGVLGYVLYALNEQKLFYGAGFMGLSILLGIYYHSRADERTCSLISPLLAFATYLIARFGRLNINSVDNYDLFFRSKFIHNRPTRHAGTKPSSSC